MPESAQPLPVGVTGSGPADGPADDPTVPGAIDMGDDDDEPGMIQIVDVDGTLIWVYSQNDRERITG